jgi:hypothetical protein
MNETAQSLGWLVGADVRTLLDVGRCSAGAKAADEAIQAVNNRDVLNFIMV